MRVWLLLLCLACSAPALSGPTLGCVSTHAVFPAETWWASPGHAREYCDGRAAWTTPSAVTETVSASPDYDNKQISISYSYTGARSGGTATYVIMEEQCMEEGAAFSVERLTCEGGPSELTEADIAVYIGYILGSFGLGYAMGYLFRVFYKAVNMI